MKKLVGNTLKIGIPLTLGVYIIWVQYNSLETEQLETIKESFRDANYFWVLLSVAFGTLSHISRAYRWRYTLAPLNIKIKFSNSLFAVMIGYAANIAFPRLGEVSRCAVVAKYENQPFEKLFGTVVAERVADMLILLSIIAVVIVLQIDILEATIEDMMTKGGDPKDLIIKLVGLGVIGLAFLIGGFVFIRKSNHSLAVKFKNLLAGLINGVLSILKMEKKWAFIGHTAFIWLMYLLMFYVVFFALPETTDVSIAGVMAAFVVGGLAIVLIQGGLGAYPAGIALVLMAYGIEKTSGITLGWLIWSAQTIMIVTFGVASIILMPIINSRKENSK